MSLVKIQGNASGTGTLTIAAPNTNSDYTLTLPASSGTVATLATVTNNGVAYVNSSGQPTSGSALVFDGTNFGLGTTPSAWTTASGYKAMDTSYAAFYGWNGGTGVAQNATLTSAGWRYRDSVSAQRYEQSGGTHAWYTSPSGTAGNAISFTQAMTLDAANNLSVGTTAIASSGQSNSLTTGAALAVKGILQNHTTAALILDYNSNRSTLRAYGATSGSGLLCFNVGGGNNSADFEAARIDSSGNLLVNRTSVLSDGQYCADFAGNTRRGIVLNNSNATISANHISFASGGSVIANISQPSASTIAYGTSSDYRLKENIAPMTGALATVAQLKPVTYKWKVDGSDGQGFIAHELAEVVPDCVQGTKDAVDAEGKPVYQGIDTSFLVATLTAAIQELKAIVDAQGAEIAALKGTA